MPKALIACFDNWDTLSEIPVVLSIAGFQVDIFCGSKSWLLHNKYFHKYIAADENPEGFVRQLINIANSDYYDWIIPGDEKIIKLLNDFVDDEALFYKILPLTKIENRELLSSKNGLSNICSKYHINSPGHVKFTIGSDTEYSGTLAYPLIVKVDFSWGGVGIKICDTPEQLTDALNSFSKGETVIIQEYIEGKEVPVEALFWKGDLLAFVRSEILEYDKDRFTYSTRRRYFPADELLKNEVEKFGKCAGVHGFVNMAYIQSETNGRYFLIEADLRPSSWFAYAKYAGVSFSKALKSVTGESKTTVTQNPVTIEIALFHKDIRRALYKRDVKGLLQWIYKPTRWKYIPFYDFKLLSYIISKLWNEFVVAKLLRQIKIAPARNRL